MIFRIDRMKKIPYLICEKIGLAAYRYWPDVIAIRNYVINAFPKVGIGNQMQIPQEMYPLLRDDFKDITISVEYTNSYVEYLGENCVQYDEENNQLCEVSINLIISRSIDPIGIERAICHEINHIYEMYERFQNKNEKQEKIDNVLKKDGNIDYEELIELRKLPMSNNLAYMLDIIYML